MIKKILLCVMVMCFAAGGWVGNNPAPPKIIGGKDIGVSKEFILELGKSGAICEVFGHQWEYGRELELKSAAGYQDVRICSICGRKEIRKIAWEKK